MRVANSRDPETLAELAAETGATAVWADGRRGRRRPGDRQHPAEEHPRPRAGDRRHGEAGRAGDRDQQLLPAAARRRIDAIEDGTPESVWVSEQLGAPVFKVFNGIYWKHLLEQRRCRPAPQGRIALPIAGDDPAGKQIVFELVDELGFDPVDGGTIEESWRQQPGTPVYGKDFDAEGVKKALAEASPERTEAFSLAA